MIPKIIHYCWFGGKKKPKLVRDCILSWKKNMPEYNIIEWNEKNSDLSHPFVKEAYGLKKWAFVADYVRLNVIYENGGIYLDTDMMVLKSFDPFLDLSCFFGAEDLSFLNAAIFGAEANNSFIKECMKEYDLLKIGQNKKFGEIAIPHIITKKFREVCNFSNEFDKVISKNSIKIYPSSFFYPYPFPFDNKKDLHDYKKFINTQSFVVHLWNSSWIEHSEFYYFRNAEYSKGFVKMLNKIVLDRSIDLKYLRKILSSIKESL
jgi:hypothetical protein